MSYAATVELIGCDGSRWTLSAPDGEFGDEGAELDIKPTGIYEAPIKLKTVAGAFQEGARYAGKQVDQRDITLPVNLWATDTDTIEEVYERFSRAWDFKRKATLRITTETSGRRELKVQLSTEIATSPDHDPNLDQFMRVVVSCVALQPFWESTAVVDTWESTASGQQTGEVTISNRTDQDCWLQWVCTAPGQWTLPDFSFGNDRHDRAVEDADRMILCPSLTTGQDMDIDTDRMMERVVCKDKSQLWARFKGVDWLYPVPPYTKKTTLPVMCNGPAGSKVTVIARQRWSRPWGGR